MTTKRQWMTFTQMLEEMERTDPELRAFVEQCDRDAAREAMYDRINARRAAEGKPPLLRHR